MPKATYLIISLVSKKWPVSLNLCQKNKIDYKRYLEKYLEIFYLSIGFRFLHVT